MSENKIDLNTASEADLDSLPGMTRNLADRIRAGRPFSSVEELKNVTGVGNKLMNKWKPRLYVNGNTEEHQQIDNESFQVEDIKQPEEDMPDENIVDSGNANQRLESEEHDAEAEQASGDAILPQENVGQEKIWEKPAPDNQEPPTAQVDDRPELRIQHSQQTSYLTRMQAILLVFITSGVSFIMAVVVTLIVLIILNGGILYASPGQVNQVQTGIARISNQVVDLQSNLQALESKLSQVDRLAEQVSEAKNLIGEIRLAVDSTQRSVETLSVDVEAVSEDVINLDKRSQVFEQFLVGLRQLLEGVSDIK